MIKIIDAKGLSGEGSPNTNKKIFFCEATNADYPYLEFITNNNSET